jgi:hypothetical protein
MCGSKPTRREVTKPLNPLKTDKTIIKAALPIVIPIIEIREMTVINPIVLLLRKYLQAINSSVDIMKT